MNADHFLKLHLLEREGKGYDAEDVKNATIQKLSWTMDINGMRKQIDNFRAICGLIFGEKSHLYNKIQSWITHINEYKNYYEDYLDIRTNFSQ